MKSRQACTILVVLLLSTVVLSFSSVGQTPVDSRSADQYRNGYRFNIQGWIYVSIQGDGYERGYQHGYLLAAEIVDMISRWSNSIHNYPIIKSISKHQSDERFERMSKIWWDFCTTQCHRLYWDKFPDEYQQEIKGIADGVVARGGKIFGRNVNYQDILALNEMYEFLSKLTRIQKGIHPLRTVLQQIQQVTPEMTHMDISTLIETFLQQSPAHHCNGFIATGDATSNGQIVFSHSTICGGGTWWWTYYISLRWNVLLDIKPANGHRILMPTSPGLIWSDEDYYQNDYGLVLLETTNPQGFFDNRGLPLSVRARSAIQYGNSIDDMLFSLRYRNDGSMNAVWLLGDTKTGEIARLDLGYRHAAIWRTFDGFYWSANIPQDVRVRLELVTVKDYVKNFILCNILGFPGWGYNSILYHPEGRDLKFEELGNRYYGAIDIEIVKEIMHTSPIGDWITDVKATDTSLLAQNGLWAFFGNPLDSLFISDFGSQTIKIEEVPATGWVRLFGLPSKEGFRLDTSTKTQKSNTADLLWSYDLEVKPYERISLSPVSDERLYITVSSGSVVCLNPLTGSLRWRTTVGKNPTVAVEYEGFIFIGDEQGISKISQTGTLQWESKTVGKIQSEPLIKQNRVRVIDSEGILYCFSKSTGKELWRISLGKPGYISQTYNENMYVSAGDACYAIDLDDNSIKWVFTSNGPITSAPVLSHDTVYVNSWDTHLYALDAETGALRWKYQMGWGFQKSPLVKDDVLIVGSVDNNLYLLNTDGSLKWVFSCNAAVQSRPMLYGGIVFFGSDDGRLYAVNSSTGDLFWSFAPGFTIDDVKNYQTTPILCDPVSYNGTVIIGANGTIYSLAAKTKETPQLMILDAAQKPLFISTYHAVILILVFIAGIIGLFFLFFQMKKKKR